MKHVDSFRRLDGEGMKTPLELAIKTFNGTDTKIIEEFIYLEKTDQDKIL